MALEFTTTYYHRSGITLACEPGAALSKPLQNLLDAAYSGDATPFNHCFIGDGKSFLPAVKPGDAAGLLAETKKVEGWGKGRTWYLPNQVKLFTDGAIFSQLMQMRDAKPDASLTNTYWKLVSVGSETYRHEGGNREPHLQLRHDGNTVTGFGGCNTYTGRFERDDSTARLRFDRLVATQRACLEGMEIEARFLAALRETNRYAIRGDTLRLLRDDEDLVGFEAVYL
jgi:heat shock protein HslJ